MSIITLCRGTNTPIRSDTMNIYDITDVLMPVSSVGGGERTHDLHWAREEPQQAMCQRDAETEVSLGSDKSRITTGAMIKLQVDIIFKMPTVVYLKSNYSNTYISL